MAWTYDTVTRTQVAGFPFDGFAAGGPWIQAVVAIGVGGGGGVEIPLAEGWTAKAEYLSTGFGRKGLTFTAAAEAFYPTLPCKASGLE